MKTGLNADVTLIASTGGAFEVVVDGKLVYSKKSTGEFPDEDILLSRLKG